MSFYENQHRARRRSSVLLVYFVAAVLAIIATVNIVSYVALMMTFEQMDMTLMEWLRFRGSWLLSGLTLLVILAGSAVRIVSLGRGGGIAVAKLAGGTPVSPATKDAKERQLVNVTEEMAIASGTQVPRIFVLGRETGINAFVAGTHPSNTVLAVTRGALDELNRDELQGVIGHEFSHILNGDMKLNIRLMGVLAGILLIGQIGEFLVRGGVRSKHDRDRKGSLQLAILGLGLMAVGYIGLFFGRLIKAAISRQREFLADASSVQFTRNPDGIASALYAIGQHSGQSRLRSLHAEDMSHLCFGETLKVSMAGLLSTHPPIDERIIAIDPSLPVRLKTRFRKRMQEHAQNTAAETAAPPAAVVTLAPLEWPGTETASFVGASNDTSVAPAAAGATAQAVDASALKASVGTVSPQHTDYAHRLHDSLPAALQQAAHDPEQAQAVVYALILCGMRSHGSESIALIKARVNETCASTVTELYRVLQRAPVAIRLPQLDIALATLRALDKDAQNNIINTCQQLIEIDNKVTLTEFIILYLLRQALNPNPKPQRSIKSFQSIEAALGTLFSAIVQSSGESSALQARNFTQVMKSFTKADCSAYLQMAPSPKQMTHALDQLNRLTPLLKQPVIDACVDCTLHDGKATLRELEVLRAVCEALECPLPPVLATA